eukprot:scaffold183331_cov21-Tisochrysis_lutea.AAC.1
MLLIVCLGQARAWLSAYVPSVHSVYGGSASECVLWAESLRKARGTFKVQFYTYDHQAPCKHLSLAPCVFSMFGHCLAISVLLHTRLDSWTGLNHSVCILNQPWTICCPWPFALCPRQGVVLETHKKQGFHDSSARRTLVPSLKSMPVILDFMSVGVSNGRRHACRQIDEAVEHTGAQLAAAWWQASASVTRCYHPTKVGMDAARRYGCANRQCAGMGHSWSVNFKER